MKSLAKMGLEKLMQILEHGKAHHGETLFIAAFATQVIWIYDSTSKLETATEFLSEARELVQQGRSSRERMWQFLFSQADKVNKFLKNLGDVKTVNFVTVQLLIEMKKTFEKQQKDVAYKLRLYESDISRYLRKMQSRLSWWSLLGVCLGGLRIGLSAFYSVRSVDQLVSVGSIGVSLRGLFTVLQIIKLNREYQQVMEQLEGGLEGITEIENYRQEILSRLQNSLEEFLNDKTMNFNNFQKRKIK